jgi:hypothetical protein
MTDVNYPLGKHMIKKYNTNFSKLLMLILDMSEEQQSKLLHQAQQLFDKRKKNRIPCLIPAHYHILDKAYHSFILDINESGAFIETSEEFPTDQPVILEYIDPFARKISKLIGQIAWSEPHAIGVKFSQDIGTLH